MTIMARSTTSRKKRTVKDVKKKSKKKVTIKIRRSSGRKEKFELDRMAQTVSRSGVPFLMARDISKKVSKKIKTEARAKGKDTTITGGRIRKMIAEELRERNQPTVASSYAGEMPKGKYEGAKLSQYEPPIGTADTDQHTAYRADRDSVMHDRSKRVR